MTPPDEDLDIAALLAAALDDEPPDDMTERVMARLAGVRTVVEFGRLIGVAPVYPLLEDVEPGDESDDD